MATQWLPEYQPHPTADKRPRKRPRANWDIPSIYPAPKEFVNGTGLNHGVSLPSYSYYPVVPRNVSPPWRADDKDGHYVFAIGENLTSRYRIVSKMGEGTFGQVLECWDTEKNELVAVKIVRSTLKYREAAMIEIDVLQKLARHDIGGKRCVQIRNWFDYRNHICIVFEKLGPSLYDFIRKNGFRSFPIDLVRELGQQLLESVAFMHELHLIHTDLKPENILLLSAECVKVPDYKYMPRSSKDVTFFKNLPRSSAIKLIDFGSTTFEHQDHSYVVSTRHYRAPEIILGLGWNYPCDLWSVGCILMELCSVSLTADGSFLLLVAHIVYRSPRTCYFLLRVTIKDTISYQFLSSLFQLNCCKVEIMGATQCMSLPPLLGTWKGLVYATFPCMQGGPFPDPVTSRSQGDNITDVNVEITCFKFQLGSSFSNI